MATIHSPIRHWTPEELDQLHTMIDRGDSYARIARRLGRTYHAVLMRCKTDGISLKHHPDLRSATQVAALFGVTVNMLCNWIARGWLPARRDGAGPRHAWRIGTMDILAFLDNDETWIAWVPSQIADPDLQQYARELRSGPPRWLAVKEIAAHFHVTDNAVWQWIRLGLLPAIEYQAYYVRAEHVATFVPPCMRKETA